MSWASTRVLGPFCGADGANAWVGRVPRHATAGSGARKRSAPIGGLAYGMPRNTNMPCSSEPSTLPDRVMTVALTMSLARG